MHRAFSRSPKLWSSGLCGRARYGRCACVCTNHPVIHACRAFYND